MGQYHIVANLTKKEFIHPHVLGCGLKLREQASTDAGTLQALFAALVCSPNRGGGDFSKHEWVGRWKGDRIAVVGDYSESSDLSEEDAVKVKRACHDGGVECDHSPTPCFKNVSPLAADFLEKEFGFKFVGGGWREREWADGRDDRPGMAPDIVIRSND